MLVVCAYVSNKLLQRYSNYYAWNVANVATWQYLLHCKFVRVVLKKVFVKRFADNEELLSVNGRLVEQTLQCAAVYAQLVCEPLICVSALPEFFADDFAYV